MIIKGLINGGVYFVGGLLACIGVKATFGGFSEVVYILSKCVLLVSIITLAYVGCQIISKALNNFLIEE